MRNNNDSEVRLLTDEQLEEIRSEVSTHMREVMKGLDTYEIVVEEGKVFQKYPDGRKYFVGR
jgi:hypothetical protein